MKYAVRILLGKGKDNTKELAIDTLDELPEKVRPVIAMLDAMELERGTYNMYVACEYGNKTVYSGFGSTPHEAYYNIWGHP